MMEGRRIPGGLFLALEGPEGGGKTVHSRHLQEWLAGLGFDTLLTREPGGTPLGEEIRRLLLAPELPALAPSAELFLFLAARAQLTREVIVPALEAGRLVITDRYATSTLVYQGYGLGLDLTSIGAMNRLATGGLEPTLTIILDIDPLRGLARRRGTQLVTDRIEGRDLDFHSRVRQGYLAEARANSERFRVVDASPSENEVWAAVKRGVASFLSRQFPETAAFFKFTSK